MQAMKQMNRSLSKSPEYSILNYASLIKGFALTFVTIALYLQCKLVHSVFSSSVETENIRAGSKIEFQTLTLYPNRSLTGQSTLDEWIQQAGKPVIGLYRYYSIATIQLPTADIEEEIEQKQTKEKEFHLDGNNDILILTRQGYKFNQEDNTHFIKNQKRQRTPNQDRVLVMSRRDNTIHGENNVNPDWWIGLFDGHGNHGHMVSQYVSSEFARRIAKEWEDESSKPSLESASKKKNTTFVKDILKSMFLEINDSIPIFLRTAGCTGISVLKKGDSLYISNVGDSVAFVASYKKKDGNVLSTPKIIYSTKPHKPDDPSERKRIEEKGGEIIEAPFEGATARVVIPMKNSQDLFYSITALAMSRSFGDYDGNSVGVIAEPDTDVLDLSLFDKNQEYIVVVATDGLIDFDKLSEEEVAQAVAKALSTGERQRNIVSTPGTEAARELIMKASQLWDSQPFEKYRDDISIAAHKL